MATNLSSLRRLYNTDVFPEDLLVIQVNVLFLKCSIINTNLYEAWARFHNQWIYP